MEIHKIMERFKPLFRYEISKFSSMGLSKDVIESEINHVVLIVSRLKLNEESIGKYLKTSIENNLRRLINKNERFIKERAHHFSRPYKFKISLEDMEMEKLNSIEKFVYILKRNGLKRREIAKILNRSESYVKAVLRTIKQKMGAKRLRKSSLVGGSYGRSIYDC